MRKSLRALIFTLLISSFSTDLIFSQDRFAFAITDVSPNTANWTVLRKLNLETGVYSDAILNGTDLKTIAYDATSKTQIGAGNVNNTSIFSTGVAAIAYDKRNNRIYYAPMYIDQLRYLDLKTMKVYYLADRPFAGTKSVNKDDGKVISRMVIAPDGYGYAISNDAEAFVRFSTIGKQIAIEQLGSLVDDPANGGISVHNGCSSWGGDIVADDAGNLYLLTARNTVFKINTTTKVATLLGPVKDLPNGFTINGVVVTDDGKLLAGSQVFSKSWYVIDPRSWKATEYKTPNGVYLTSDLANSNYLSINKRTTEIATIPSQDLPFANIVQLYPNPISIDDNQFKLQFNKLTAGDYTVELTDVTGKQVMTQKISVIAEGQIQNINLRKNTAQGIYLVKISDFSNKTVFTQKLIVQ
jgi:Secretion system C-terminal sorting domain